MQSHQDKGISMQEASSSLASHTSFVNREWMSPKTKYPVQEPEYTTSVCPKKTLPFFAWDLILPLSLPSFELICFQVE